MEITATTIARIARYHHPNFVSAQPGRWNDTFTFTFKPFTGREPRPELNVAVYDDRDVSLDDRILLGREYEAARTLWSKAKFTLHAKPALTRAVPVWHEYARAHKAMDAAYAAFWDTQDTQWRAQILKLTDTHREALAAAEKWDEVAKGLAKLQDEHADDTDYDDRLSLRGIAVELKLDIQDWCIGCLDDYERSYYRTDSPLVQEVKKQIEEQTARLREVGNLAGDR